MLRRRSGRRCSTFPKGGVWAVHKLLGNKLQPQTFVQPHRRRQDRGRCIVPDEPPRTRGPPPSPGQQEQVKRIGSLCTRQDAMMFRRINPLPALRTVARPLRVSTSAQPSPTSNTERRRTSAASAGGKHAGKQHQDRQQRHSTFVAPALAQNTGFEQQKRPRQP